MLDIAPFEVMEVQRRARALEAQGHRVIHMEIGQPDFPAPPPIVEAGMHALREGNLAYTDTPGLPALREAIARFHEERHGVLVDPARIMITPGASGALLVALGTLVEAGDEVLIPDPGYPCTRHFVRMFEGTPTMLPVDATGRHQPRAEDVTHAWRARTRGVALASPANPAGTTIDADELRRIGDAVRARGGFTLVDEIYQGLVYDVEPTTALSAIDDCVVVNSFSKYFCMTGWRLGWLIAPPALMAPMERLAQNAYICAPAPAQHAAMAAFAPETLAILEAHRETFRQRRDFLVPALRTLGFSIPVVPDGAFYVYAGCERFTSDSRAFAASLLEHAGVAATPGCDFGDH